MFMWSALVPYCCRHPDEFDYQVEADKGFNFSTFDNSFVCQKKNHFQVSQSFTCMCVCVCVCVQKDQITFSFEKVTVQIRLPGLSKYLKKKVKWCNTNQYYICILLAQSYNHFTGWRNWSHSFFWNPSQWGQGAAKHYSCLYHMPPIIIDPFCKLFQLEALNTTIDIEQSKTDRTKTPYEPIMWEIKKCYQVVFVLAIYKHVLCALACM